MLTETIPTVAVRNNSNRDDPSLRSPRTFADIRALDRALVLADLPSARAAFLRLQEDLPLIAEAVSTEPFPVSARPRRALQQLAQCLIRENLSGARKAFDAFARPDSPGNFA
jgi:hypothetical protein